MIGLEQKESQTPAAKMENPVTVRCRNCTEHTDHESVKVGWNNYPFCSDACKDIFGNSILKA